MLRRPRATACRLDDRLLPPRWISLLALSVRPRLPSSPAPPGEAAAASPVKIFVSMTISQLTFFSGPNIKSRARTGADGRSGRLR